MRPFVVAALFALACLPAFSIVLDAAPAPAMDCKGPEYRQLDFWIGDWDVTAAGEPAGTNRVTLDVEGCVVHEHWSGVNGGTGESMNFYDRRDGKWHQVWVGSHGRVAFFTGGFADGRMAYVGDPARGNGGPMRSKMTFFDNRDGTVRQLWETSTDDGKTWQTAFDGLYRKTKKK